MKKHLNLEARSLIAVYLAERKSLCEIADKRYFFIKTAKNTTIKRFKKALFLPCFRYVCVNSDTDCVYSVLSPLKNSFLSLIFRFFPKISGNFSEILHFPFQRKIGLYSVPVCVSCSLRRCTNSSWQGVLQIPYLVNRC